MSSKVATIARSRNKGLLLKELWEDKDKYLMITPFFIFYFIFTIAPIVIALLLSFTDFNMIGIPNFVWFENYQKLFLEDSIFLIAVKNTFLFALITGPISYFLCLIMAWLINELPPIPRAFLTFLFYAPSIAGNLYVIWSLIFSGDMYGWANGLLMDLGLIYEPIQWLTDAKYNLTIIIIVQLWMSFGSGFLSFIAGLQGVDRSLYEAAALDGIRNRWQEFLYVTIPSMGPQLMFGAVMQISASFSAGRICIALAGNPSTDYSASTVITHLIDYGTYRYEMGYACSIATVLFIAMLLCNNLIKKVLNKYI